MRTIARKCSMWGCKTNQYCRGYCPKHYERLLNYGDPKFVKQVQGEGRSKHPLSQTYRMMKQRCYNPKAPNYHRYGGKGIYVCKRWLGVRGFSNFISDMGDKPSPRHSLDRINGSRGYSPTNCRWATPHQQSCNTVRNNSTPGVGYSKHNKNWFAQITIAGVIHYIGGYPTEVEASKARIDYENRLGIVCK